MFRIVAAYRVRGTSVRGERTTNNLRICDIEIENKVQKDLGKNTECRSDPFLESTRKNTGR